MYLFMYMYVHLQKIIRIRHVLSRAIHVESLPSANYCYNYTVICIRVNNRNCERYISAIIRTMFAGYILDA